LRPTKPSHAHKLSLAIPRYDSLANLGFLQAPIRRSKVHQRTEPKTLMGPTTTISLIHMPHVYHADQQPKLKLIPTIAPPPTGRKFQ
jgi:hypothetical protein